jgi:hypothetical protein
MATIKKKVLKKTKTSKSEASSGPANVRVITGKARSSYMYCRELAHNGKNKDGTINTEGSKTVRSQIIIPKSDKKTVNAIKGAILTAAKKKFGNDVKVSGRKFGNPLRDGDAELEEGDLEGSHYEDSYFMSVTGYKLPGVVNQQNERIEDPDELDEIVVSGYYFRFSITAKAYDNDSKGVRFVLNNLMFQGKGERLDGGKSAEDEFGDFAEERDDDDEFDDDDD